MTALLLLSKKFSLSNLPSDWKLKVILLFKIRLMHDNMVNSSMKLNSNFIYQDNSIFKKSNSTSEWMILTRKKEPKLDGNIL